VSTDRPRASPFEGIAANAQQTETYGIAADGTPLHWETLQPSGSGPWPFVLLIHGGGFKAGDTHLPFNACAQDVVNAGYFAASIEYRLAPPGQLLGQTSDDRFPDQTNDIELAAAAARADFRCNGKVFAIGGSAGASHPAWLAGRNVVNAAVLMSPAMQFDDPVSLQNSNFSHDVTNYAPNNLSAASPINVLASHAAPNFLMAFEQDSMPAPQYLLTVAKLAALAASFDSWLLPGQGHSFDAWPTIKSQAITFRNAHRGRLASPAG
jgi:acetyl esterase/lipase